MEIYRDEFEAFEQELLKAAAHNEAYEMHFPELANAYYEELRKDNPEVRMYCTNDYTQYFVLTEKQKLDLLKRLQNLRDYHESAMADLSLTMSAVMSDMKL